MENNFLRNSDRGARGFKRNGKTSKNASTNTMESILLRQNVCQICHFFAKKEIPTIILHFPHRFLQHFQMCEQLNANLKQRFLLSQN